MHLDRTYISPEEQWRRRVKGACFYCGPSPQELSNKEKDALSSGCRPSRGRHPYQCQLLPVFLNHGQRTHLVQAPIDSSSDCKLINSASAKALGIPALPLETNFNSLSPVDQYITKSLAAGIIHSFSSPAGTGFYFAGKKDGSLHPCINYRGLNDITLKNRYPSPLMATAVKLFSQAIYLPLHPHLRG